MKCGPGALNSLGLLKPLSLKVDHQSVGCE